MAISFEQSALVSICPDPVIAVDQKGIITLFNPAAEKLLGYIADEAVGQLDIRSLYPSEEEARRIVQLMLSSKLGESGRIEGYETHIVTSAGQLVPIRLSASMVSDGGKRCGSIGFFHDMTRQKTLEANLKKQSITDDLSGLYNQRYFYTQVAREMERAKRYGYELGLVCIDLDGFKQVNDRMGHLEGDHIIRTIGHSLLSDLREADQAFRYGGDEFMLLLPNTDADRVMVLADRLRKKFNHSCVYASGYADSAEAEVKVSMSLGGSTSRGDEPVDYFVQRADMAMYKAKQSGGDCVQVFQLESKCSETV